MLNLQLGLGGRWSQSFPCMMFFEKKKTYVLLFVGVHYHSFGVEGWLSAHLFYVMEDFDPNFMLSSSTLTIGSLHMILQSAILLTLIGKEQQQNICLHSYTLLTTKSAWKHQKKPSKYPNSLYNIINTYRQPQHPLTLLTKEEDGKTT